MDGNIDFGAVGLILVIVGALVFAMGSVWWWSSRQKGHRGNQTLAARLLIFLGIGIVAIGAAMLQGIGRG